MKRTKTTLNPAALAASALALTGLSANAATTVWNVNVGAGTGPGESHEITTGDNYVGAATENTINSTWNSIQSTATTTLVDSTNDSGGSAGVTIGIAAGAGFGFSVTVETLGDEVFHTWMKDNGASYDVAFGGLSTAVGTTYDLVIYSGWYWGPENGVPVTQIAGAGLATTFTINSHRMQLPGDPNEFGGLAEDTDSGNVPGDFNYARFNGLAADGSGNLTFTIGAGDHPINGFQLIQVPEPTTTALLGLGSLVLLCRRRK